MRGGNMHHSRLAFNRVLSHTIPLSRTDLLLPIPCSERHVPREQVRAPVGTDIFHSIDDSTPLALWLKCHRRTRTAATQQSCHKNRFRTPLLTPAPLHWTTPKAGSLLSQRRAQ